MSAVQSPNSITSAGADMQIECTTMRAAQQVLLILLGAQLRRGQEFQLDSPHVLDPPTRFIVHVDLPPKSLRRLRHIPGISIELERCA